MLVRFFIQNLFSFDELTEFNMIPGRFNRMPYHVYEEKTNLLKLNVTYGANGAGKSNLIKSLTLLQEFVTKGYLPIEFITETFKFKPDSEKKDIYLGIEFIKGAVPYYYDITINQGIIVQEELQISGLGTKEDVTLFTRTDDVSGEKLQLHFSPRIEDMPLLKQLTEFAKADFSERNQPLLYYMNSRKSLSFGDIRNAMSWFASDLVPIMPNIQPSGIALHLETDKTFYQFASEVMQAFHTGIENIQVDTMPIEQYFGEDNKQEASRITSDLRANPGKVQSVKNGIEEILFVLRDDKAYVKRLQFVHTVNGKKVKFSSTEESDGTRRLLDYLPALFMAIHTKQVFLIDEIERSIHPLLIKELIRKFSHDTETKGQLIFSTHESNLLDQDIFRPDEIWFAEKNGKGATELYPLSEFKEHHTIDIRKGYLNGRYGGIPFLGNLTDLNWDQYAKAE